jgi:hypothetical protein
MEPDLTSTPPATRRRSWLRRIGPVAAALVAVAFLASACGGNSGSANGSTSSEDQQASAVAYAQCMRSQGVTKFPDPGSQGSSNLSGSGIDTNSTQFQSAEKACLPLASHSDTNSPAQNQNEESQALKYATCMRSHGVTDFPDPPAPGSAAQTITPQSVDANSPTFQSAQKACAKEAPTGGGVAS